MHVSRRPWVGCGSRSPGHQWGGLLAVAGVAGLLPLVDVRAALRAGPLGAGQCGGGLLQARAASPQRLILVGTRSDVEAYAASIATHGSVLLVGACVVRRRAESDGRRPLAGADRPQPRPGRRAGLRGGCGRRGRGARPGRGRRRRPCPDLGLRAPSGHAQHRRPGRRGGPPPDAPALAGGRVGHRPCGAAGRCREPGRQDRPGPGRRAGPAGADVPGPAGHVGRGPAGLARSRPVRADPRRARRRAVPDVQDAQHAHRRRGAAGRVRGGERDGRHAVQDPPRPPGHAGRLPAAPLLARRAPAAVERAPRGHVADRTASGAAGRGSDVRAGGEAPSGGAARHHGALAGQRALDLSWDESVRLDLFYADNWRILDDLAIAARTVVAVTQARGAY